MRLGTQRPFCWRKIEHPWDWGPWCIEAHWSAPGSQRLTFNFSFLAVVMAACLKLLANVRRDLLAHDNGCLYTVCHFISSFPNRVLMRQLGNEATLDLQVRKMTRSQQSDACSFKTWKVTLKTLCKVSITTLLSWWFWCFSWWQQLLCTFFFFGYSWLDRTVRVWWSLQLSAEMKPKLITLVQLFRHELWKVMDVT